MREVRHISISIDRPPREVYEFASRPENLPRWASGLGGSIRRVGDEWIADGPMGRMRIEFVGANGLGVLDHEVTLESGARFYNPMRVVANGEGSEVVFTLFRTSDMSAEKFAADARWVAKDLGKLKAVLEDQGQAG